MVTVLSNETVEENNNNSLTKLNLSSNETIKKVPYIEFKVGNVRGSIYIPSNPTGVSVIIGLAVFGIILIIVVLFIIACCYRRYLLRRKGLTDR